MNAVSNFTLMSLIHYLLQAEARYQANKQASDTYVDDQNDSGGETDKDDVNTNGNST